MKEKIDPEALEVMRARARSGTHWGVFQNKAMDSQQAGHLQFLMYGEGCTYKECPPRMPDTQFGTGWKYLVIGIVNLETGEIIPLEGDHA